MKTTTKTPYLFLAAAAALTLTLSACSNDDAGDTGTTADDTAAESTDDGAAEESTEAPEETEEAGASAGAECLVGTWEITPEALEEQILATYGGEGEVSVEGGSSITFDGSTYTATSDSTATFDVEMEGVQLQGSTVTDGTFVVTYTADDTTISFGEVESADGTITTDLAGQQQEISLADTASALEGFTQDYTCSDTELVVTTGVGDTSIDQTYTRS